MRRGQAGHKSKQTQQRTIGGRIYRGRRHGVTLVRQEQGRHTRAQRNETVSHHHTTENNAHRNQHNIA
eukprot:197559-Pyramimonas_sp.AAC.1